MTRPSWPSYFMSIAQAAARRGTCDRKRVGCVIVIGKRIVATGYNGAPPGMPHCDDPTVGHDVDANQNCIRAIHAEENAVAQAARHGTKIEGASAFVNTYPCWRCFRLLASAGVKAVHYDADYKNDPRVVDAAQRMGIALLRVED